MRLVADGFHVFEGEAGLSAWAKAARRVALRISADPVARAANLRHGNTWFVGVDALPNDAEGGIDGVPLTGDWQSHVPLPSSWHAAQLSIVYPGYPAQDASESDANHRFRIKRHAAHVDGLLPIGPNRRRFLREPHAFVLGLPLNTCDASPLMVWPGSHRMMGDAFRAMLGDRPAQDVDLTDGYTAARARVFEAIRPRPVIARPGQAIMLHRHLLHGVAAWRPDDTAPPEGRMIAYFRPQFSAKAWLSLD